MHQNNPLSNYRIVALNDLASIEYYYGNIEESISLYKEMLKIKVVDSIGNGYKYSASGKLSRIYFDRKEFKTTLKYLDYQKKNKCVGFCGNAQELEDLDVAMLSANCYLALGNRNKAIDVLSPHIFDDIFIPNTEIVNLVFSIYQNIYTKEQIRTEFQNAHKSLRVKKEKYGKLKYYEYSVKLFGRQTFVKGFLIDKNSDLKSKENDFKKKAIEEILKSKIYALTTRA